MQIYTVFGYEELNIITKSTSLAFIFNQGNKLYILVNSMFTKLPMQTTHWEPTSLKSFGNSWGYSRSKFVVLDIKYRCTCGDSDLR